MKRDDADFWKEMLLENADYLFRKRLAQKTNLAISTDELVQETIKHVVKILQKEISAETNEFLIRLINEECIGTNLFKIKEGHVIPGYYLGDIFLKKAKELFSEESRRYKSVLSTDELIGAVVAQIKTFEEVKDNAQMWADLYTFLEKLCNEDRYFRKIQNQYIIFDKNGKDRLEAISKSG